jgi:D-threonate/D-erythronate kinase
MRASSTSRAAYGIIADDLTGACDTALQFCACGYAATVALAGTQPILEPGAASAIDCDSRDCVPEEAYGRVRAAVGRLAGARQLYKKVDSTLRGNVGAELDALLDASGAPALLLAPAFPAGGRVVRAGQLLVHGTPLAATPFAAALPRASSSVAELVAATARSPIAGITLEAVRAGGAALDAALAQAAREARILIGDVEHDGDLQALAEALARRAWPAAGSAGLAAALARLEQPPAAARPLARARGPILIVVGSRNPAALAQLAHLRAAPDLQALLLDGAALLGNQHAAEIARAAEALGGLLAQGDVVLTPDPQGADRSDEPEAARALAHRLGLIAERVAAHIGGLVITGGSTAAGLLPKLGIGALELAAEVEVGVPALVARDGRPGLPIVTKAGGFGGAETLARARAFLRG